MCSTIETHASKNEVMDDKTLLEQYKKRVQELTKMVQVAEEGRDEQRQNKREQQHDSRLTSRAHSEHSSG